MSQPAQEPSCGEAELGERHAQASIRSRDRARHLVGPLHTAKEAARRSYSYSAAILYDYSPRDVESRGLVELLTKNQAFEKVAQDYLKLITFGSDDYASGLVLQITKQPVFEIDLKGAFGQPLFLKVGARVEDVLARFRGVMAFEPALSSRERA